MGYTREPEKGFTPGEVLVQHRLVRLTAASGTQVEYCDSEDTPIGVVIESDPNMVAGEGSVSVRMLNAGGTFEVMAAGAFSIGDHLYPADDGKVDDVVNDTKAVFVALEAATADGDIVEVRSLFASESGSALLFASAAASTTHTASAAATDFDVVATIQPEDIQIGDVLEISAIVDVIAANGADTLALELGLGTEALAQIAAFNITTGDIGYFHAFVRIQATGAAGNIRAHGEQSLGVPGTIVPTKFIKAAAAEDLSAAFTIVVQATFDSANAGNQAALNQLVVFRHRH